MKKTIAVLLLCIGTQAQAAPFSAGDPSAGKKLFEQNHCNSCHITVVGGDGSAIFTRSERKVTHPQQLIKQIYLCSGSVGLKLTPQEEQHIGAYLNQNYYKFK